jgi:hypothetical protein
VIPPRRARPLPGALSWVLAALAAAAGAITLYAMGRLPICACGTVKLWHGAVMSSENSQHLSDWYSPSHVLHGLLFYLVLAWLAPAWALGQRLVAATLLEVGWEILENTGWAIERYRAGTISLDYYGDSIVNSTADVALMWLGFLIAARAPVWVSAALFVAAELAVGLVVRDGLILNVIMFVWPQPAILAWQQGG